MLASLWIVYHPTWSGTSNPCLSSLWSTNPESSLSHFFHQWPFSPVPQLSVLYNRYFDDTAVTHISWFYQEDRYKACLIILICVGFCVDTRQCRIQIRKIRRISCGFTSWSMQGVIHCFCDLNRMIIILCAIFYHSRRLWMVQWLSFQGIIGECLKYRNDRYGPITTSIKDRQLDKLHHYWDCIVHTHRLHYFIKLHRSPGLKIFVQIFVGPLLNSNKLSSNSLIVSFLNASWTKRALTWGGAVAYGLLGSVNRSSLGLAVLILNSKDPSKIFYTALSSITWELVSEMF